MLSERAIDALIRFGDQWNYAIPTRGLGRDMIEKLEELLLAWDEDPSEDNALALMEAFPDPGGDAYL